MGLGHTRRLVVHKRKNNTRSWRVLKNARFLFGLFVRLIGFAGFAELLKLKTRFELLVFGRVVVHLFAFGALEFDQILLGHRRGVLWKRSYRACAGAW